MVSPPLARGQQDRGTDNRIRFYQKKLQEDPDYFINYNRLASAYLQKARESGDLTYYELAEKTVKKSVEVESTHPEAASGFSLYSAIDYAEHKFQAAADKAEQAIKLDPSDPGAYASAGEAYMEQGEYEKAGKYFAHLESTGRFNPRLSYLNSTRKASLALAIGHPRIAIPELQRAIDDAKQASLPPENVAWTEFTLGEAWLQVGELANAEEAFQRSLRDFPSYHRALAGLARVRVAQHRYPQAVAAYKMAMAIIPLPIYAAALGDVYRKLGDNAEAQRQYSLVQYIASLSFLSKTVYNRELAIFYADHDVHVDTAVELARRELQLRHDIYTQDSLAWALYKDGKHQEALAAISPLEGYRPDDALLLFHWGIIHDAAGEIAKASSLLRQALALNPEFHIFFADQARARLDAQQGTLPAKTQ